MNKIRITLDPGHAKDYNRGSVSTYYESNRMYELALKLKGLLENYKIFEVYVTKSKLDCCPSLAERGNMAIKNGSRMFISLHSNACGTPSVYRTIVYQSVKRKDTDSFVQKMITAIANTFKKYGQGKEGEIVHNKTSSGADYYGVLRNATLSDGVEYAFLIEHDFHTNKEACVIMDNEKFWDECAVAEAKCIYDELKKLYIPDNLTTVVGKSTATLNVRTGPGLNYQRLGSFNKGDSVKVYSKNGAWYKVLWNGCAAWVSSSYVSLETNMVPNDETVDFSPPSQTPAIEIEPTPENVCATYLIMPTASMSGKVVTNVLNVRSGPDTSYRVIDTLTSGTLVGIHASQTGGENSLLKNWYYITYGTDEKHGFVCSDYVENQTETLPTAIVNANVGLNYRTGPSTTYEKVGCLPYGTRVYTLGVDSKNPTWMKIILSPTSNEVFYVSKAYLTAQVQTDSNDKVNVSVYIDCQYGKTIKDVAVRSMPSTSGRKISSLKANTIVCISNTVSDTSNSTKWLQIINGATYGYIDEAYVDIIYKPTNKDIVYTAEMENLIFNELPQMSAEEWFCKTLSGTVTSPFGWRTHPISGNMQFHSGIDIGARSGTSIVTPIDGICIYNGYDDSCGNMIILLDEMGRQHRFLHMVSPGIFSVGEFAFAGETVGQVGTTGNSTGNHLHYEIRLAPWAANDVIDPAKFSFQ